MVGRVAAEMTVKATADAVRMDLRSFIYLIPFQE
jgi:hypothetical protein